MRTTDSQTNLPRRPRSRTVVWLVTAVTLVIVVAAKGSDLVGMAPPQRDVTDADLESASGARVITVGALGERGRVATLPLELYVARVLAGEGEPRAAAAAYEALAVAVRTFALANAGRHARDGFDLCDTTHCQVPRPATSAARRAALATASQILTYHGRPAEVFYSASCGGHSESGSIVWPGMDYPYLRAARDEVHDDDESWSIELTLGEIQRALRRAGFAGQRLRDVRVEARSESGRATRLRLPGMEPDEVSGERFRAAIGANGLRSTAFSIERRGASVRLTGRGYGHGVGLCVIGAGRRATRGADAKAILAQYYPGLELARLDEVAAGRPAVAAAVPPDAPRPASGSVARVPPLSAITAADVEHMAARAQQELSGILGASAAPLSVHVHESLESFRHATGQPWWVGAVSTASSIDLAPVAVLAQRDGLEAALRTAIADLIISEALAGRPEWVRVGAARYFGRGTRRAPLTPSARVRCPSDAELTLAISATAQREAEARAEACFAREYAETGDWREVR